MSRQNPPRRLILVLLCYCMATGGVLVVGPATCLSTMAADARARHDLRDRGLLKPEAQMGSMLPSSRPRYCGVNGP